MQIYLIKVNGQTCDVGFIHESDDPQTGLAAEDVIALEDVGLLPSEVGIIDHDLPKGMLLESQGRRVK